MSLRDNVSVNSLYTRSINLERDFGNESLISSYIPTARAKTLYDRVCSVLGNQLAPRAYSLVGPYGSGKSSFSVFLSHLLSHPDSNEFKLAHNVLEEHQVDSRQALKEHVNGTDGYLKVLISGSPEPLSKRILAGLHETVLNYWSTKKGRKPNVIADVGKALEENLTGKDVADLFSKVQEEINKLKGIKPAGILLVIDELGKFLEYEARHYGANDIFTLQTLAEQACEGNECQFLIFVMLHQSFEQYSKGLGETLKHEWAKVQGRYEEVPFLESAEQTLKIVSRAIDSKFSEASYNKIKSSVDEVSVALAEEKALPSVLQLDDATELFRRCYPLHPLSALLLPYLCQKLAQNERTLFSFLGSHEEFGFEDALDKISNIGLFLQPDIIFDYFVTNQSSAISDNITHRRWAEVISAIERLGAEAPESALKLLKLIGLFNIVGSKGNLKPSEEVLKTTYESEEEYIADIAYLRGKSIVTYRAFNNEFRVWQGSDFDLDLELQNQLSVLGNFSLSEQLNKSEIVNPIVAKKYSIKFGSIRYFKPFFIDAATYKQAFDSVSEVPRILFYLSFGQDDETRFYSELVPNAGNKDIVVLVPNSTQLRDSFAEVFALKRIEESSQALKEDPVAKKEFSERFQSARSQGNALAARCLSQPDLAVWYFDKVEIEIESNRKLQAALSEVMETLYSEAPVFQNELINKDKPSSQAAAGRKQLVQRLIENAGEELLGLPKDKFPPEKSMYLAIIKEHGLHENKKGSWILKEPGRSSTLMPVWKRLEKFVSTAEESPRSFSELSSELQAAPFGIKAGVLPIIYIVFYLVKQNELAWFEEGKFQPGLDIQGAERFFKMPHLFSVQSFKIAGLKANLFASYKAALFGTSADVKERTVIDIAKPLVKFIADLEDYTRQTNSKALSDKARRLKKAFELSKSPQKLLFSQLPKALGFDTEAIESQEEQSLAKFSETLTETLRELKYHYKQMLEEQAKVIASAFHVEFSSDIKEIREQLVGRFLGLDLHTADTDGLKAFIKRLTSKVDSDIAWLESVLSFLASNKPPRVWLDKDRAQADFRLSDFSERVLDLEIIVRTEEKLIGRNEGAFDLVMLKSLRKGNDSKQQAIPIYNNQRKSIQAIKDAVEEVLAGQDKNLILAVLAGLVDDRLKSNDNK